MQVRDAEVVLGEVTRHERPREVERHVALARHERTGRWDVHAERRVALLEAGLVGVGPERGPGDPDAQVVQVELQAAERVERTQEVRDEPPLEVETRRAAALPVDDELPAQIGERRRRDALGDATRDVERAGGVDHRRVCEHPEAATPEVELARERRAVDERVAVAHRRDETRMASLEQPPHLDFAIRLGPHREHGLEVIVGHGEPNQQRFGQAAARQRERRLRLDRVESPEPRGIGRVEPEPRGDCLDVHHASFTTHCVPRVESRQIRRPAQRELGGWVVHFVMVVRRRGHATAHLGMASARSPLGAAARR